jgi:hypothetical protein
VELSVDVRCHRRNTAVPIARAAAAEAAAESVREDRGKAHACSARLPEASRTFTAEEHSRKAMQPSGPVCDASSARGHV